MHNICILRVNGKDVWISSFSSTRDDSSLYYGYSESGSGQNNMPNGIVLRGGEFYDTACGKYLSKLDVADRIKSNG